MYALMTGAGPVTSIVSTRIYPVMLPEGQQLPALVIDHVSTYRPAVIDAFAANHLAQARIQCNCLASDHTTCRSLADAVRTAAQFQRGSIASVTVVSVLHAGEGPATFDVDLKVFHQPIDFIITYQQS